MGYKQNAFQSIRRVKLSKSTSSAIYKNWLIILPLPLHSVRKLVTGSCRDGWDERIWSASQVQMLLSIVNLYKIGDGWNVRNRPIYCRVWILTLKNLHCLSCKSINFVLLTHINVVFWLFRLCVCVWLFSMYESSYAIIHKIRLFTLSLRYER